MIAVLSNSLIVRVREMSKLSDDEGVEVMCDIKHKKIVTAFYNVSFNSSNRGLPDRINEFLKGCPDIDQDDWQDNHTVLRDYEGDYEGIEIYHDPKTVELIKWIYDKLDVSYEENKGLSIKLTT